MTELCEVTSLDESHYSIKFVPKEMGVHTVSVKHKDMHIPGELCYSCWNGGGSDGSIDDDASHDVRMIIVII